MIDEEMREQLAQQVGEVSISVTLPNGDYQEDWVLGRVNARAVIAEIERHFDIVPKAPTNEEGLA